MREIDCRVGKFGALSRAWKGESAGYVAIHMWLTRHFEKQSCEICLKPLSGVSRLEWANISGEYKRDRSDYLCLCPPCHRKKDLRKNNCPAGHVLDGANLKVNSRGHRTCRTCTTKQRIEHKRRKYNAAGN